MTLVHGNNKEESTMASKRERNHFATENQVEKEEVKEILAEETADKTEETTSEESEVKEAEVVAEPEIKETPAKKAAVDKKKTVKVICDRLYIRPEPNKAGTPLGVLTEGDKLELVETDAKLPVEWIEVITIPTGLHGFVMKEFVQ